MEIKKSILFNKVRVDTEITSSTLCLGLNKNRYDDNLGIGVLTALEDEGVVHVEILIRTPTYISNYDHRTNTFQNNVVNVFDEVIIDIDLNCHILYSSSPSSKLNKAKAFIRNVFKGRIVFDNILFTNDKIKCWLDSAGYEHCILSMTIRKFVYADGATGRFSANISSQEIGERLLCSYKDDVNNVVLHVEPRSMSPFVMQYGTQNAVTLKCEEADFWSIVEFIKRSVQ